MFLVSVAKTASYNERLDNAIFDWVLRTVSNKRLVDSFDFIQYQSLT